MKRDKKNSTLFSPATARRRRAEQAGRVAEAAVARLLEARGFSILGRRLRTPSGEIDIVAANDEVLAFVEVKLRTSMAEAAESVSARQQRRLGAAAEILLAANPAWQRPGTRFDVAFHLADGIVYLEDAFRVAAP